jgi:hypothetical protein
MLQQAIHGQERTLRQDHKDMLNAKHWLGEVLYKQNKRSGSEQLLLLNLGYMILYLMLIYHLKM